MGTIGSTDPTASSGGEASSSSSSSSSFLARVVRGGVGRGGEGGGGGGSPSSSSSSPSSAPASSFARRAHHAGSWYESSPSALNDELASYLRNAAALEDDDASFPSSTSPPPSSKRVGGGIPRAIVSPHAGYRYSGPTAAHAYRALTEAASIGGGVNRIVVLHPSHHVRLDGCAVSGASVLETPLGNLPVDDDLRRELLSTNRFVVMDRLTDEREHSGEMQYPYVVKALKDAASAAAADAVKNNNNNNGLVSTSSSSSSSSSEDGTDDGPSVATTTIPVLPVMVGSISPSLERRYGSLLAPHLAVPGTFVVISTDFCHWGDRFGYAPLPPKGGNGGGRQRRLKIYEFIEELDRVGMSNVELQDPGAFAKYLKSTENTICGRHPLAVWLNALKINRDEGREALDVNFVKYDQSGRVTDVEDSSVSYASAVARSSRADDA